MSKNNIPFTPPARFTRLASPNFTARRHGRGPDMVVLHHTAMTSTKAAVERLCDPKAEVSAHYVISQTGAVFQLVAEDMRAWHAGAGCWAGIQDVNSHSIGIELANAGPLAQFPPFGAGQMNALEQLLAGILSRHQIPPPNVIAHSDMAPERKFDPGCKFDWQRLAALGLSVWTDVRDGDLPPDMPQFLAIAQKFGYCPAASGDDGTANDAVLDAFRLRFRAGAKGPLDRTDMAMIAALARDFPATVGLDARANKT